MDPGFGNVPVIEPCVPCSVSVSVSLNIIHRLLQMIEIVDSRTSISENSVGFCCLKMQK